MAILKKIIIILFFAVSITARAQVTFAPPSCTEYSKPRIGGNYCPIADFNRDGKQDIAVQELASNTGPYNTSNIAIYFGNGNGNFSYYKSINLTNYKTIIGLSSADYNKDGIADIAVHEQNEKREVILIFQGNGLGDFHLSNTVELGPTNPGNSYKVTNSDFNGDGNIDFIVTKQSEHKISLFSGDGSGNYKVSGEITFSSESFLYDIVSTDMNGDGMHDLIVSNLALKNEIYLIYGNRNNKYEFKTVREWAGGKLNCSDLNNDGKIDIASVNSSGISVFLADNLGTYSPIPTIPTPNARNIGSIAGEDFNNDGNIDLAVNYADSIYTLVGNGTGNFIFSKARYRDGNTFMNMSDFNGDGKIDILSFPGFGCGTNGGVWTRLNTTPIANKDLDFYYYPKSSGNGGDVTISFSDLSIKPGMTVKLVKGGSSEIVAEQIIHVRQFEMKVVFNLRSKEIGEYDIVLTDPAGNVFTQPRGFKITPFERPEIWTQIIGRTVVRVDRPNLVTIQIGNNGNCDAMGVPFWLFVTGNTKIKFISNIQNVDGTKIDSVFYSHASNVGHNNKNGKIYWFILPKIPAGGVINIKAEIIASSLFEVNSYVNDPIFSSPLGKDADECLKEMLNLLKDAIVTAIGDDIISCTNGFDKSVTDLYSRINSGKEWSEIEALDFGYGLAGTVVSCAKAGTTFLAPQYKLTKELLEFADVVLNPSGTASGFAKALYVCTKGLGPNPFGKNDSREIFPGMSVDPNDKIGNGVSAKHYITGNEPLSYGIRFENSPKATAAAQVVILVDTLDKSKFDLTTFQLNFFNFSGKYIDFMPGQRKKTEFVDLRPKQNLILKVKAELDTNSGIFTTEYTSLDPLTMHLTEDPVLGFLPPNTNPPIGEGGIYYSVSAKTELPNKTFITNKALIYFDTNAPISTPIWSNIIDKLAPDSKVDALPDNTSDTSFVINWKGHDGESGIEKYSIYYAVNDSPYKPLLLNTVSLTYKFTGKVDSTYSFYSIAIDSVRNTELNPPSFDARTTIRKPLSVEQNKNSEFSVYPNPFNNGLIIEPKGTPKIESISLLDVAGKEVSINQITQSNDKYELDLDNISSGIYLLRIKSKKGSFVMKVVRE